MQGGEIAPILPSSHDRSAALCPSPPRQPNTNPANLSAVRSMQISLGFPDPREQSSLPLLKRVQAGIARARMMRGTPGKLRLPITATVLAQIRGILFSSTVPERVTIWAIACVAFFGFFRLGELLPESASSFNLATDLTWGDVAVDNQANPRMVRVHLKKSKCDQFGVGSNNILGRTDNVLCPVAAILQFIATRGGHPGPFFIDSSQKVITKQWFVGHIRNTLNTLGLPQHNYAGHSFRIGAATTAALAGVEDSTILTLGRWQSAAFLQYVRMPSEQLASLSRVLSQTGCSGAPT